MLAVVAMGCTAGVEIHVHVHWGRRRRRVGEPLRWCVLFLQIKLADFGFARHFTEEGTKKPVDMSSLAGTPVFMVSARAARLDVIRAHEYACECVWVRSSPHLCMGQDHLLFQFQCMMIYTASISMVCHGGGGDHVTGHDPAVLSLWFQLWLPFSLILLLHPYLK